MKKVWILFVGLLLISSFSFAQQGLLSKDDLVSSPVLSTGDLHKNVYFSPTLPATPGLSFTELQTNQSTGFAGLGLTSKPKALGDDENSVFPRGCALANLGIGVGNLYWGSGYGNALAIAPTLDIDVAITNKLGIGNIGIGGTVSYSSSTYNDGYNNYKFTGILVGLRASYHFMFNIDALKDKLDPYAGVLLGYIITNNPSYANDSYYNEYGTKSNAFQPGIFAGAHYYFVTHFGVFAELGYNGFSIFTLGITIKTK
jgi:hypothetical protein